MQAIREIKFRIYDKETGRMFYPGDRPFWLSPWGVPVYNETRLESFEVMQFTGLRDKNGKEIYEGDIVRQNDCGGTFDHVVRWIDEEACYVFDAGEWYGSTDMDFERCEVIGNIYENPELLELDSEG